jgi:hypothetical protein
MKRESVNSFFLFAITVLLTLIGFFTRNAYNELKDNVAAIQTTVNSIERRTIVLETIVNPPVKLQSNKR